MFCVGFQPQRGTEGMGLQVIFMGNGLRYKEIVDGLGRAVVAELIKLSKGDWKLALKLTDGFLETFLEEVGKIPETHKGEM